jgi:serine/threonine protein kinase
VAHFDLEPRNIMIDKKSAKARIIDFGISKTMDDEDDIFKTAIRDDLKNLDLIYDKLELLSSK